MLEKIIAFLIATFLWFIIAFPAETIQRDFSIPISYRNLSENLVIEDVRPKEITVTLAGRGERAFDPAAAEALQVSIDGTRLVANINTLRIDETMIVHPLNLSVVKINPIQIQVVARQYAEANIPISAIVKGSAARGYAIDTIIVSPKSITLLLPEGREVPQTITTEPIDINGIHGDTSFTAKLLLPSGARLRQTTDANILVTVNIKKR